MEGTYAAAPSVARPGGQSRGMWQPSPGQKTVRADVPLREHATPVVGVQAVLGRWAQQVVCIAIMWGHGFSKGGGAKDPQVVTQGLGLAEPKESSELCEEREGCLQELKERQGLNAIMWRIYTFLYETKGSY